MSTGHAVIAPSSMARTIACPGSVVMERGFPEPESPAAREGTAAHEPAAMMVAQAARGERLHCGLKVASNGEPITDEMLQGAEEMALAVQRVMRRESSFSPRIEETLSGEVIHPECFGTPDVWLLSADGRRLHVFDYKFGHRTVSAFENWQLLAYTWMILATLEGVEEVVLHVIQPRGYHRNGAPTTWSTTVSELRPALATMQRAAQAALGPSPETRPGPQCLDCTARAHCRAARDAAAGVMDFAQQASPETLDAHALSLELAYLERAQQLLEARRTGLEAEALALAQAGTQLPHWALRPSQGRERWATPVSQVLALGRLYNTDLADTPRAVAPSRARKAGIPEAALAAFTEKPEGEPKLHRDDGSHARYIFSRGNSYE